MSKILNTLCKWRQVYVMMATMNDATAAQRVIRDQAEAKLIHRAELSALVALLIQKKVFTDVEWTAQREVEAEHLMEEMEKKFPGFKSHANGMTMTNPKALQTMNGWKRPYGLGEDN